METLEGAGLSGEEFLRRAREVGSDFRVLVISGYADRLIIMNGETGVGDPFLRKPFQMEKRRYHPHVTLARCGSKSPADISLFLKKNRGFGTAPFRVEQYTLFSSVLGEQGARYRSERVIPFE